MSTRSQRFYCDLGKVYSDISFLRGFMIGGYWDLGDDFGWRLDQARRGIVFRDPPCYLMFSESIDRGYRVLGQLQELFVSTGVQKCGTVRMIQVMDIRDWCDSKMPYDWVLYAFDEALLGDGLVSFYQGVLDYLVGEGMFAVDKVSMDKYVRISAENRCRFGV